MWAQIAYPLVQRDEPRSQPRPASWFEVAISWINPERTSKPKTLEQMRVLTDSPKPVLVVEFSWLGFIVRWPRRGRARRALMRGAWSLAASNAFWSSPGMGVGSQRPPAQVRVTRWAPRLRVTVPLPSLRRHGDMGVEHLHIVAIQRHDIGAAIALALHKGVPGSIMVTSAIVGLPT